MSSSQKRQHDGSSSSDESSTTVKETNSTSTSVNKFTCPDKFQKCKPDYDGLCLEDVKEDSEIWLIRAPLDVETSLLDGEKLIRNAQYNRGKNNEYEVSVKESKQVGNITVVLPSKTKKSLLPGPAFKGLITVTNSVNVSQVDLPMSPPKMSFDIPPDLKQRFKPFGCGSPLKRIKESRQEDNLFVDSITKIENLDFPVSPSKKRKKKYEKDDKSSNESVEDKEVTVDFQDKSSNKKKKKKKDKECNKIEISTQDIKIKQEELSEQNVVNTPPKKIKIKEEIENIEKDNLGTSQIKKKKKKHKRN